MTSPLDTRVPKTGLLAGRTIKGGLIFAGVDGAPEEQGNPAAIKVAPRAGVTYAPSKNTVFRGGYGLFYAPWNYTRAKHGQVGFTRTTALIQSDPTTGVPIVSLENPFPGGLIQPIGSSLGLLTGTGGTIEFVDQDKGDPKVHQYSFDVQRELPGAMAVTIGYIGATGRDIGYFGTGGGSSGEAININQIDPAVARAAFPGPNGTWNAAALRASVPNPFFGVAGAGEFADVRPFRRVSCCVRSRSSATSTCSRRPTAGGGNITRRPSCSTSGRPAGGAAASAIR